MRDATLKEARIISRNVGSRIAWGPKMAVIIEDGVDEAYDPRWKASTAADAEWKREWQLKRRQK